MLTRFLQLLMCCIFLWEDEVSAQQNNTWQFGSQAGITFNPSGLTPVPRTITNSAMTATEGCSSICDENGKTLFYTNGRIVYNKNNVPMQNGTNLLGHPSAFQSSVIVQQPNSDNIFYIFTADAAENNFANGYRYSVVDMSLSAGLGAVTLRDQLLSAPSSERLTAARHANGIDVWIIGNDPNSNVFRAWLLTCTGLTTVPVVSTTGIVLDSYNSMNTGSLKVSPDGKQVCQTHFPDGDHPDEGNFFQLFDFNNATGIIGNPRSISFGDARYFSCEYSPDSKLLYVTKSDLSEIDQYQCKLPGAIQIMASMSSIPAAPSLCGLQLAPDGKIYASTISSRLHVISKPNVPGAGCSFIPDKIDLAGNFGALAMPSFVNDISVDPFNYIDVRILDTCAGKVQFEGHSLFSGVVNWSWDFGDGNFSTQQNPVHTFADIRQLYLVKLVIRPASICGYIKRSKYLYPAGLLTDAAFTVINHCDSGYVRFTNQSTWYPEYPVQFNWDFGDGEHSTEAEPRHTYALPGNYTVKLKLITNATCLDDETSHTVDVTQISVSASPDQIVNEGDPVFLHASSTGHTISWQPSKWLNNTTIADPVSIPMDDITYIVTALNEAGCKARDTVKITVIPKDDIYVPSAFTPDNNGKNDIFKPYLSLQYNINAFRVYNRWGQVIYQTSTRDEGWDGKVSGVLQDSNLFIWTLKITNRKGKIIQKSGTVLLIR